MLSIDKQTDKQTDDRQTNQRYQKHNLLCQGGNYAKFIITSLCFWWRWFVCLFVCLSVCGQHYLKIMNGFG